MLRLVSRIAAVLLLSVVTLGGWSTRFAVIGQEAGCTHTGGSPAAMGAHDGMAPAGQASAAMGGGVMAAMLGMEADAEQEAPCCAPADDIPRAPCSTDHGATPCGTTQACATANAFRPTVGAAPVASLPSHPVPLAAPAARVTEPVLVPDVPPPRASLPVVTS